ncbi:MAG TPA: biotin/lipoyl-containing protein [Candidatus Binatia bacterium]|nr:biotin/lipoyl-containing protein [Candidatus Binatia bacterium]
MGSPGAPAGRPTRFTALVGDETRAVEVVPLGDGRFEVTIDGRTRVVDARPTGSVSFSLVIDAVPAEVSVVARGDAYRVWFGGRMHRLRLLDDRALRAHRRSAGGSGEREVRAAMPGKVVTVLVEVGATVEQGEGLLVLEAMKMENEVGSPRTGTVREVRVKAGQAVEAGELLAIVE